MTRLTGSAKLLRAMNSSATLAHLLQAGQLTRAELRELTGLSKPTSSEMLRLLTEAGLALVAGRTVGAPGPTAEIYAPNPDAAYAVAVSVRDTTEEDRPDLAIALCDLNGKVRDRTECRVDFTEVSPAEAVTKAVIEACQRADIDLARVLRVQIGVAGSYDRRTDTIHHVDVPGWSGPGVLGEVRSRLAGNLGVPRGGATVTLENDVNLAAIAERHRGVVAKGHGGVAEGAESFVLLWLGYGIGLATDLGGTLLRGAHGGAGEIGYLPLYRASDDADPDDLQRLIGGPAVIRLAAEAGIGADTAGDAVTAAIARGADRVLEVLAHRIAFALATVVAVLDPPLVVLAGEVAQAGGAKLRDAVVAAMYPAAPQPPPGITGGDVQIAVTAVADDAVLLGGLDAGLHALRESLISSLALPSLD